MSEYGKVKSPYELVIMNLPLLIFVFIIFQNVSQEGSGRTQYKREFLPEILISSCSCPEALMLMRIYAIVPASCVSPLPERKNSFNVYILTLIATYMY